MLPLTRGPAMRSKFWVWAGFVVQALSVIAAGLVDYKRGLQLLPGAPLSSHIVFMFFYFPRAKFPDTLKALWLLFLACAFLAAASLGFSGWFIHSRGVCRSWHVLVQCACCWAYSSFSQEPKDSRTGALGRAGGGTRAWPRREGSQGWLPLDPQRYPPR